MYKCSHLGCGGCRDVRTLWFRQITLHTNNTVAHGKGICLSCKTNLNPCWSCCLMPLPSPSPPSPTHCSILSYVAPLPVPSTPHSLLHPVLCCPLPVPSIPPTLCSIPTCHAGMFLPTVWRLPLEFFIIFIFASVPRKQGEVLTSMSPGLGYAK